MKKLSRKAFAVIAASALVLAACGGDDADETVAPPVEAPADDVEAVDFLACQITDTGGIDDKSFNETAWNGFLRARDELGIEVRYLESTSESDYEPHINTFVEAGCDFIVTVGFLLGDATETAAQQYPDVAFGIIDYGYEQVYENLLAMVFATDQAGFLAGYVAADQTETGIVGTWGGLNIPPVSIFMDGFLAGVNHYNEVKGTSVRVLGWDGNDGVFINDFDSQDLGNAATTEMLQNGADIILPVAGPAGAGAGTAIADFGSGKLIWVDTDGFVRFEDTFGPFVLTSVEKRMDTAVFDAIQALLGGTFQGGTYLGTLENDGVGISPFHLLDGDISAELKAELEALRAAIVAGELVTTP